MRVLLVLTLLSAVAPGARADEAGDMLQEVYESSAKVQRLEATFVQTKELKAFAQPMTSSGVLIYERDGAVTWRYESPDRMEFVMEGTRARMHYPDLGEEQEFDLASDDRVRPLVESMTVWLDGSPDQVRESYEVTAEAGRERTLILTPRNEMIRGFIQRMVLTYGEDALVTELRIDEPDGDATTYRFTNQQVQRAP